jgi:hypothetical protein
MSFLKKLLLSSTQLFSNLWRYVVRAVCAIASALEPREAPPELPISWNPWTCPSLAVQGRLASINKITRRGEAIFLIAYAF